MDDTPDLATRFFPGVAPEDIDLYATLDLTKEAKPEDIKKAYRAKFQQVGFAYAVLSDETRRRRYDQSGRIDEGGGLEPGEGGWHAYFEDLFNVTRGKLDEMKKEYQGMSTSSEEEENGLKRQQKRGGTPDGLLAKDGAAEEHESQPTYLARDVDSDDDLKVTRYELEQEELRSARITKREDAMAEAEEKRREASATTSRQGKDGRLPGGAINATDSGGSSASPSGSRISSPSANGMTARTRLASSFAPTLTKLNIEKRDTRTIDEIVRDLKRGNIGGSGEVDPVLSGEKAQNFRDWFFKKEKGKAAGPGDPKERPEIASAVPGRTDGLSATNHPILKPNASGRAHPPSANPSGSTSANPQDRPRPSLAQNKPAAGSSSLKPQASATPRKRSRERSFSLDSFIEDDENSEGGRRYAQPKPGAVGRHPLDEDLGGDTRELIWQLMGRKRSDYVVRDVDSDDDMEVTGYELEREELRSARIAKREDAMEEAEEKRREEEKKRRKAERSTRK